ncbi:MAG: hypothetical protein QOF62_2326 [Pyrinomonadaceae bacterium]|nr:hypothetical protein [Pyrinomonadaceae bacterium]
MRAQSDPIKVLHVINDLSVGGAEMVLYRLLSAIDRRRFDCTVVSLKDNGTLRAQIAALGVPVHSLAIAGPAIRPASIWRLLRLLKQAAPDIIQGWLPHGNLIALLAGTFTSERVPVIWNIRQSLESFEYEKPMTQKAIKLGSRLSRKPATIVYNSRSGAAQHEEFGYSAAKATVIHNGFDTKVFAPSIEARACVRAELGVAADTVLIGLVSRYHAVKNHANFLRAAAELRKRYSNVEFVMCGSGVSWDNRPLRQLIQDLALTSAVHLLGPRPDMPRIIAALDIAASASYGEGFPNAIGEAMACAVPCVVTDVSDLSWIIKNAGIVVPKNDASSMAQAFAEMLELGVEARHVLGGNGRARVMEHFRLTAIAEKYSTLYESVLARNARERNNAPFPSRSEVYSDSSTPETVDAPV